MNNMRTYSKTQNAFLVILRFIIGWHILYEGIAKLINPHWSSLSFLQQSQGLMSGFAGWLMSSENLLRIVDFFNIWGLIAIGAGLILGLFAKQASIAGAVLLFVYYLSAPPLIGVEYLMPVDGNNLLVDKTLIEAVSLCVLALFPTSHVFGIDAFLLKKRIN